MKESLIGLYVDNTEVPEYKSAGASGFDLRAKFNPKFRGLIKVLLVGY
jgi:dUTPase